MLTKKGKNEGVGIASIVIIVIVAVIGLYYFFSHRPHENTVEGHNPHAPTEVVAPASDDYTGK